MFGVQINFIDAKNKKIKTMLNSPTVLHIQEYKSTKKKKKKGRKPSFETIAYEKGLTFLLYAVDPSKTLRSER